MKRVLTVALAVTIILSASLSASASTPFMQTTGLTLTGILYKDGSLYHGACQTKAKLFDAEAGGTELANVDVGYINVYDGAYSLSADFGTALFDGRRLWVELQMLCAGDFDYQVISRTEVAPVGYALWANGAGTAITATYAISSGGGMTGTASYVPYWLSATALGDSPIRVVGNSYIDISAVTDQATYPSVNASQTAATLQDGSASTGTSELIDNTWEAIKFTTSGNHTVRSFGVRLKSSAALSNPTASISGYIYSDSAGSPGSSIGGPSTTRYGSLTTSFAEYQFAVSTALVSGTSYWIVLKQSAAPTGGTISIDTTNSGTGLYSYSSNGTSWTNEDTKTGWFKLYGRTYAGVQGSSTNHFGVYGSSTNNIGVYGVSINNSGVYGNSMSSYGVYGNSVNNTGVYGSSTNNIGMMGSSTSSYGVYGTSTSNTGVNGLSTNGSGVNGSSTSSFGVSGSSENNAGIYGHSINSYGGLIYINGAQTAHNTANTAIIRRYSSGAYNATGNVLQITDNPTVGGTIAGALLSGQVSTTERLRFDPRVTDGASAVGAFIDTQTNLATTGALLLSLRNAGTQKVSVSYAGDIWLAGNVSADSFTDRTPGLPPGYDALSELRKVASVSDAKGGYGIDHTTLPAFARVTRTTPAQKIVSTDYVDPLCPRPDTEETEATCAKYEVVTEIPERTEDLRDVGAMVTVLTSAVQQLDAQSLRRVNVPAGSKDKCSVGDVATDEKFFYVCAAQDTWRRIAWSADAW